MGIVQQSRKLLIRLGKSLPFLICFIVLVSYLEGLNALVMGNYLSYHDYTTLSTPISNMIARYFEYDMMMVIVCLITGIATETCVWNKIVTAYLAIHILFKYYIESIEITMQLAIIFCIVNIIIASYLVFKGVKILLKH